MAGQGVATIDFGAFPGSNEAQVDVTGQTGIAAASSGAEAYVMGGDTTTDHTANDHRYIGLFMQLSCGNLVDDTGFTIYARSEHKLQGTFKVRWVWA